VSTKRRRKWLGVLMAFFLNGSAHFVTGCRTAGVTWYLSIHGIQFLSVILIAVPGTATLILGVSGILFWLAAWIVMLVGSHRPIPSLGVKGWIGFLFALLLIRAGEQIVLHTFVQSFKVSGGAMQPTINGIRVESWSEGDGRRPSLMDRALRGAKFIEVRARNSGTFVRYGRRTGCSLHVDSYRIGPEHYEMPRSAVPRVSRDEVVSEGDLLWSGIRRPGDHLFAEKISYRFREPKRGDVVVFSTDSIQHVQVRAGDFYVKRVAGLPGDRVSIHPPDLLINGEKLKVPKIFDRIASGQDGYNGFVPATGRSSGAFLSDTNDIVKLGEDEYLVLGDNTHYSLDGRYFGPISRSSIVGRITRIYWPFDRIKALDGK